MRRFWISLLLIGLPWSSGWCADAGLSGLDQALTSIRSTQGANDLGDAGPELTPIKRELRTWVEGFLPAESTNLPGPHDFDPLSESLNRKLNDAGLTCGESTSIPSRCVADAKSDFDARGFLGDVRVSSLEDGRYMLVVTAVGIRCGFDESAYVYARGPDHLWKLLLESEQDDYGQDEYAPQNFLAIDVSPSDVAWNEPAPPPLVLTLGNSPGCYSNWQSLSTRLWRTSASTPTPRPLIDRKDTLYLGDDVIASASLTQRSALIEFRGQSIDSGTLVRSHVLHYLVQEGDKLRRVAPVALSPDDFVEEWLKSDWAQARRWSDARANASVSAQAHGRLQSDFGDFDGPATRCRADHTLWQVKFAAENQKKDTDPGPTSYFLVRWNAPYAFSLVRIGRHAFANCGEVVTMPDDPGTLFPEQGWVR